MSHMTMKDVMSCNFSALWVRSAQVWQYSCRTYAL